MRMKIWLLASMWTLGMACSDDGAVDEASTASAASSTTSATGGQAGAGGQTSCADDILDGSETDVDCGGDCPGCDLGQMCVQNSDCASGACAGNVCARWGRWFDALFALDVATHPEGGLVVGANFSGVIDGDGFGTPVTSAGGLDALVVRYSSDGNVVFVKRIGGVAPENQTGVAVAGDGSILVTAICNGPIDIDGNVLAAVGGQDVLVVKLSPTGDLLWGHIFGSATGSEIVFGRGFDAAGNVYVSGGFSDSTVSAGFSVGSTTLMSVGGSDAFVFKLDANGSPVWAQRFGGASDDGFARMVVAPSGAVLVTGQFTGAADFGTGMLQSAGGSDGLIASIDAQTGATQWAIRYGGSGDESGGAIDSDSAGNPAVVASFFGSIDIAAGDPLSSMGDRDFFVAKLAASDGSVTWARAFGGVDSDGDGAGVAYTPEGDVVVGTQFSSAGIDLGGGPLPSAGAGDALVLRLAGATGAHQTSEAIGGADTERIFDIAVDATSNNVVIAGTFYGSLVFGADTLTAMMGPDCYVASLGRLPSN